MLYYIHLTLPYLKQFQNENVYIQSKKVKKNQKISFSEEQVCQKVMMSVLN